VFAKAAPHTRRKDYCLHGKSVARLKAFCIAFMPIKTLLTHGFSFYRIHVMKKTIIGNNK
jgi:hypothetical protein